jgi:hypothetical protein
METNLKSPVKILIKELEKFQVREDKKSGAMRIVMTLKDYKLLKNKVKQLEEDILEFSYFNGMHDGMNHYKNINKNK